MKFYSDIHLPYTYVVVDWQDYLKDDFSHTRRCKSFKEAKAAAELWTRCGMFKDPIIVKMKIWYADSEPF